MPNRAGKHDNHDSNDGSPEHARPGDTAARDAFGSDIPAEDASREDDHRTASRGPATAAAPVESWMPAWWHVAGGLVVFGATGLGLAWLGGVVGVVLIMVLLAAVIWLLSHWASWV